MKETPTETTTETSTKTTASTTKRKAAKKTTKRKAPKKTTKKPPADTLAGEAEPPKKKRGRPKKIPAPPPADLPDIPPKKRGRPARAKNIRRPEVVDLATRCPTCDSTARGPYKALPVQAWDGLDPAGNPFTHIVRRVCHCLKCGQVRTDRTYENRKK